MTARSRLLGRVQLGTDVTGAVLPIAPCNICHGSIFGLGPQGRLSSTGRLPACSGCGALERHRIARDIVSLVSSELLAGRRALHLGSPPALDPDVLAELCVLECKADLPSLGDASHDWVVAHCDTQELHELLRITSPQGAVLVSRDPAPGRVGGRAFALPQTARLELVASDPCTATVGVVDVYAHSPDVLRAIEQAVGVGNVITRLVSDGPPEVARTPLPSRLFKLAVVAIVKDEGPYLEEWLAYHILLGCEHFYLFDNGSSDDSHAMLSKFVNYGYVTRIDWPLFPGQIDAYNYAARSFGHLAEWLTFIDVDEFFLLKQHDSLPELLATLDCDQLLVFWMMFGHSGHRRRPPGRVIGEYVHCEAQLSQVTKAIVRSDRIRLAQVHNCITTTGFTISDAPAPLPEDWIHLKERRSEELIRINHYFTRSYEEYEAKIRRGQVDGRSDKVLRPYEDFDFETEDSALASRAADVEDWLAGFRELPSQPHRYAPLTQAGSFSTPRNFLLQAQDVVNAALEDMIPATGQIDHFRFGTFAWFEDVSIGPRLAVWMSERLAGWAQATHGDVLARMSDPSLPPFEFRNGSTHGTCFQAVNGDPQIVATIARPSPLAYHWLAAVIAVPEQTNVDLFAFGVDAHGEELMQTRMVAVPRGLLLLVMAINDIPLRIRSGRLDPGSVAGRYEVWDLALVASR